MASTPLLGLTLPADGTTNWGTLVNTSLTALVDSAIAGTTTINVDSDVTLTSTTEAPNEARQMIILCSGVRTGLRTIIAPARSKVYVVINNTSGGFGTKIVGAGPTTGITVPNGQTYMVAWNGVDFVNLNNTTVNLATDVAGILPIANGGTGAAAISSGVVTSNGTTLSSVTQPAGDLVGTTATQTLTNKTVQLRVSTVVSIPGPTFNPDVNNYDMFVVTSQSSSLAFGTATGTPYNGQRVIFRVTAASTIAISFSSAFNGYRAVGVILPSSLSGGYTLYVGCIWNSSISQWDVLAVNTGI